jgi:transcriptional regulator GlxA family with amidase domain
MAENRRKSSAYRLAKGASQDYCGDLHKLQNCQHESPRIIFSHRCCGRSAAGFARARAGIQTCIGYRICTKWPKISDMDRTAKTAVYIVVTPGILLLDLAGIAEPLRLANRLVRESGKPEPFELRVIGPHGETQSSLPILLSGCAALPDKLAGLAGYPAWVIVVGTATASRAEIDARKKANSATVGWLRDVVRPAIDSACARLLTVCSGALVAAEAGLLDGRHCTTHHELIDQLRREYPHAIVEDDRIFVIDGPVATSAGITAGIDLALAAIAEHCSAAIASAVARDLVVYWRRAGGDPQLSPLIDHRNHLHPAVHRAQDAIIAKPQSAWGAEQIASAACVSQRHIRRLFTEHAGITPIAYVNRIRVALARQCLQSEAVSVEEAATRVGFGSARQLRDAWRQVADDSPGDVKRQ